MYFKKPNESVKNYKIRLFENRKEYGLSFHQIAKLINDVTGDTKAESTYRMWFNCYKEGYSDALEMSSSESEILKKKVELEQERIRLSDYRNSLKKTIRESSRKQTLREIIENAILEKKPYEKMEGVVKSASSNDLMICLDDIHFGANISNNWNIYNSNVAKQRLELYLQNILSIQKTHNSEDCYVCCNGDLISGNIHPTIQIENKENVVEQVIGVSELISWFLLELSATFSHVFFSVVSGNHSRISTKENSPKDERLDDLVPWYIKSRLQNIENVFILDRSLDSTMNVVRIRGLNYLNVHGDYDGLKSIQKIIDMIDSPIYCVHMGHLHTNMTAYVGKYKIIQSGSLQGMDNYCIEKRIYGKAQQLVCVCDNNGIVCSYDVVLQKE